MSKSTLSISKKGRPDWVNPVLQGLAYWIGYRQQFYDGHLINEGAVVSEAVGLLSSKLDSNYSIRCEVLYSDIVEKHRGRDRADIIINDQNQIESVIELKRFESGKTMIEMICASCHRLKEKTFKLDVF
jgi:hypothetical protein